MKQLIRKTLIVSSLLLTTQISFAKICPLPWKSAVGNVEDCNLQEFTIETWDSLSIFNKKLNVNIRSGYLSENKNVPFRGNIIYFEGLGDSMLNHMPLFSKLTNSGYRVIAFDYMGQGGSSGSMNDTRISEIGKLGDKIWNLHARDLTNYPKKNIIGWSTGGLAAFLHAKYNSSVNNIVLIAPGIAPNIKVGEQDILKFKFNQITLESLTTQTYNDNEINPHIDPIYPQSPLHVLDFAYDLTSTAFINRYTRIRSDVNGFVLLSGDNDTYVDAQETYSIFKSIAPQFSVLQYPNTLHEIDNEAEPYGPMSHQDILNFLNKFN